MNSYHFAFGAPTAQATVRAQPEDFEVREELGFAPDGEGDHILLHVRKRNTNTEWLARQLAKFAGVKAVDVGYCGLKDRNAVTTQWFSVHVAGKVEPDWTRLNSVEIEVLAAVRNRRKLKRGAHTANRFVITLRDVQGDPAALEARLHAIAAYGVPNYFGEQRFGIDSNNIEHARAMFAGAVEVKDRHQRGIYLSAARSLLFNGVLSRRVGDGTWNQALPGDALILDGTRSFFVADAIDDAIVHRINTHDVHPSGPLWGRGAVIPHGPAGTLEAEALAEYDLFRLGLENAGLEQERRALRLPVRGWVWTWPDSNRLQLEFVLPPGAYATAVLREIVRTN